MSDPYCYKNGVLKNKLGIQDYDELCHVERDLLKTKVLSSRFVTSRKMDARLLKDIHRFIFGGLFEWAGEYRKTPLYKEEIYFIPGLSVQYPAPEDIDGQLKNEMSAINSLRWSEMGDDEIAKEFAIHIARIWKVHPFRDGNTRSVLGFAKIYAMEHGFPMDMEVLTRLLSRPTNSAGEPVGLSLRDMFVGASLDEYPEPEYLIRVFLRALQ